MKKLVLLLLLSSTLMAVEMIEVSDVEATYSNNKSNDASKETKQSINIGFANTTGNSDTLNLNGKYSLSSTIDSYNSKPLKMLFDTSVFMTKNNGVTDNEEYLANLDLEQYLTDSWLIYLSIDWLKNKFTNYDNKIALGGGFGKEIFANDKHSLKLKVGFAYNTEEFSNAQATNEFSSLNEYLEYENKISDTSKFYIKLGAMQSIDDFSNDYELLTVIGLTVIVSEKLSLTIEEEIRYDGLPPVGFDNTDTKTIVRLGYNF